MSNLIPPEAKRAVKREYWTRVISVWGLMLAAVFLIFSTLIIPTYVLFTSQLDVLKRETTMMQEDGDNEYQDALLAVDAANELAKQLVKKQHNLGPSIVLDALQEVLQEGIALTNFSYALDDGAITSVHIRGEAVDRSTLANFATDIEQHTLFTEAKVPVSSLTKESELPFDITILIANQ